MNARDYLAVSIISTIAVIIVARWIVIIYKGLKEYDRK